MELAEYYFQQGVNLKYIDNDGWNLLHLLACSNNTEGTKKSFIDAVHGGNQKIVSKVVLLQSNNIKNSRWKSPLLWVIWFGNTEIPKLFIEKGAYLSSKIQGKTYLEYIKYK